MAKPTQSPYTSPTSGATISWPKRGGKEMRKRMATGMRNPAGVSRRATENGVSFCALDQFCCISGIHGMAVICPLRSLHRRDVLLCTWKRPRRRYRLYGVLPSYQRRSRCICRQTNRRDIRMYLDENRSFFQFTGLKSVSHSSAFVVVNASLEASLGVIAFDISTPPLPRSAARACSLSSA